MNKFNNNIFTYLKYYLFLTINKIKINNNQIIISIKES
jgi:hypothetical protein